MSCLPLFYGVRPTAQLQDYMRISGTFLSTLPTCGNHQVHRFRSLVVSTDGLAVVGGRKTVTPRTLVRRSLGARGRTPRLLTDSTGT